MMYQGKSNRLTSPLFEALEDRRLLSASLNDATGVLTVIGTNANDTVQIYAEPAAPPPQTGTDQQTQAQDTTETPPVSQTIHVIINGGTDQKFEGVKGVVACGGNGNDSIKIDETNTAVNVPVSLFGGNGDDILTSGAGSAILNGGNGNDVLTSGAGSATLCGGNGNDSLTGGSGAAVMYGANGNDVLTAGSGGATMYGGNGNDKFVGGSGTDVMYGGHGNDEFVTGDDKIVDGKADLLKHKKQHQNHGKKNDDTDDDSQNGTPQTGTQQNGAPQNNGQNGNGNSSANAHKHGHGNGKGQGNKKH